ncbi:MAG: CotH kinase family protein [Verrucomicrobia bacterium]|nr:CotH kinase family protein [Verrucomicrobiota bacterium]MCH8525822.1 CotH kinase family protein [Kiritimatiellia bacterium]
MRQRKRLLTWLAALALVAGLISSDRVLFDLPESALGSATRRVSRTLRRNHGLAFLLAFDASGPNEWAHGGRVLTPGIDVVRQDDGFYGVFTGTRWSVVHSRIDWRILEDSHSISVRLRLFPDADKQDIFFYDGAARGHTGFRLSNGYLLWHPPATGDEDALKFPFTEWGNRVDLVGTYNAETGEAVLYLNGEEKDRRILKETGGLPPENINLGSSRWYAMPFPLHGAIQDAAAWNRALSPGEIQQLAQRKAPLHQHLARPQTFALRLARGFERGTKLLPRYLDFFNPWLMTGGGGGEIPVFHLEFRRRDLRRQNRDHRQSLLSGRRTRRAARFRPATFRSGTAALPAEIALGGHDLAYADTFRKSFIVDLDSPWNGEVRSLRLTPPESGHWIVPALEQALAEALNVPRPRSGWCRVTVNGRHAGIYAYRDDWELNPFSGDMDVLLAGPLNPLDWDSMFRGEQEADAPWHFFRIEALPLSANEFAALLDTVETRTRELLSRDRNAPFSRRELNRKLRKARRELEALHPGHSGEISAAERLAFLHPHMLRGINPSAWYIRDDLNLAAGLPAGLDIRWQSSRPDIVSPDGKLIQRPEGGTPVEVILTAFLRDPNGETASRDFLFRVMPAHPRIPAMMIHVGRPLSKSRRVDARVARYVASEAEPDRRRAFQGNRSGIKFRGNTSFWQTFFQDIENPTHRKLSMSLRFEDPHNDLGDSGTRHIYLANGYSDSTFLRNSFSYKLYTLMRDPERERPAATVEWAEIFINGHYQGLFEFGNRIDRHLLGWSREMLESTHPPISYKFVGRGDNFGQFLPQNMHMRPRPFSVQNLEPYQALIDAVQSPGPDRFVERINPLIDLEGIIDWELLLNLTGNHDGMNPNLYLIRLPGPDGRLTILPWDYDNTFLHHDPVWLSNSLTQRLRRDYPEYMDRLRQRWAALREGPWETEALLHLLNEKQSRIKGYPEWDDVHWRGRYTLDVPFEEAFQIMKSRLTERLEWMDTLLTIDSSKKND